MPPQAEWLNQLIALLQAGQLAVLQMLGALGLVPLLDGQPAWPFDLRLSGENLLIDADQARRLAWTLAVSVCALGLCLLGAAWRRVRPLAWVLLPVLLVAAPWPDRRVLLVPATPASFHVSPTGFSATAIDDGRALYVQHCAACHGTDGRGQGALAARQPVWPPDFSGPLLWRRADGDLWWRILHGVQGRDGRSTMPGFAARLSARDAWALIDYLKAMGAGEALRRAGFWPQPVRLPDIPVRCDGRPERPLHSWHGQRVRVVADGPAAATVREDPRFVTVLLRNAQASAGTAQIACVAEAPQAWQAFRLVTGADRLEDVQVLADRDGWLRARGEPGNAGWSEDDLLCRSDGRPRAGPEPVKAVADGLSALVAAMDAQPVRFVKGGFIH